MAPWHVLGRLIEHHALADQVTVGAIDVIDDEIERWLTWRAPLLRRPGHGRHESQTRARPGLDEQVVVGWVVLSLGESQRDRIEVLDAVHVVTGVVEMMS